ncbi:MAG: protein of unknown function rane [Clostridiales bacterium]|nr:protein of unknown function rane [Clostridiales bacterium]
MEFLLIALVIGFAIGYKNFVPNFFSRALYRIINVSLIITLIALGAKIGATPEVINAINHLGLQALVLGVLATSGSIGVVYLIEKNIDLTSELKEGWDEKETEGSYSILPVLISLAAGILLGLFVIPAKLLEYVNLTVVIALYVMVFGVGTDLGSKRELLQKIKKYGLKAVILPLGVLIGAIAGGIIAGIILDIPLNTSAGIAAGCGFYSFTGPYISEVVSIKLGTIGFLANLFREIITFFILPFLAQKIGKISSLATGGATTMDTTLPVIVKVVGNKFAILAIISGMVLTAIVPILVPFIIRL